MEEPAEVVWIQYLTQGHFNIQVGDHATSWATAAPLTPELRLMVEWWGWNQESCSQLVWCVYKAKFIYFDLSTEATRINRNRHDHVAAYCSLLSCTYFKLLYLNLIKLKIVRWWTSSWEYFMAFPWSRMNSHAFMSITRWLNMLSYIFVAVVITVSAVLTLRTKHGHSECIYLYFLTNVSHYKAFININH